MTPKDDFAEKAKKRIAHIEEHVLHGFDNNDQCIKNIQYGLGSPAGSTLTLRSHAMASAMRSWFVEHDLAATRQWMYVAAKLDRLYYRMTDDASGPGSKMLQLLAPLLSNDRGLIEWFARYDGAYNLERINNTKTHDFWAYQAIVALRGEWAQLERRCEQVLGGPPKSAVEQKYIGDHQFYLALARGDAKEMQIAIRDLLTPKALSGRANDESGYTKGLISTPAVIYSKIAWLHGFPVDIESHYVPREWLPTSPLKIYNDVYPFLTNDNVE
jgi:hypothetical protein